eukprot:15468314-Alexandrium_andersonii.AAC.1
MPYPGARVAIRAGSACGASSAGFLGERSRTPSRGARFRAGRAVSGGRVAGDLFQDPRVWIGAQFRSCRNVAGRGPDARRGSWATKVRTYMLFLRAAHKGQ